jgi:hypothetical protein
MCAHAKLVLSAIVGMLLCQASASAQIDGKVWSAMPNLVKTYYVAGAMESIDSWFFLSVSGSKGTVKPNLDSDKACFVRAFLVYYEGGAKYRKNITVDQVVSGVDQFLDDYRYRSFMAKDAIVVVFMRIAGDPEVDIQSQIDTFRKTAKE